MSDKELYDKLKALHEKAEACPHKAISCAMCQIRSHRFLTEHGPDLLRMMEEWKRIEARLALSSVQTISLFLSAPCVWCGYNGVNYWQAGSHAPECRWFAVGGFENRLQSFARHKESERERT